MKTQGLENQNLIDVWKEVGVVDDNVPEFIEFQDKATEFQIETLKAKAISTLLDALFASEEDGDRINAAKALLQHFRSEKQRMERKAGKIKGEDLLAGQGELFGPWSGNKE